MSVAGSTTTDEMDPATRGAAPTVRLNARPHDDSHAVTKAAAAATGAVRRLLEATLTALGYGHVVRRAHDRVDTSETASAKVCVGQNVDLVSVMLTLVIGGVVGYVGLQVMSTTAEQTALTSGDKFYNASESLTDGISGAFGQLGIVFTVIILTVIVAYLTMMRGR